MHCNAWPIRPLRAHCESFDQLLRLFDPFITLDAPGKTNDFVFKARDVAVVQFRQLVQCLDATFLEFLFQARADATDPFPLVPATCTA